MGRKKKTDPIDRMESETNSFSLFDGTMGMKRKSNFISNNADMAMYNYDVTPFQHPLLKRYGGIDPYNFYHREVLYQTSGFLRNLSLDIIWEITRSGWEYKGANPPIWDDQLKLFVVDGVSLSLVTGSTFLMILDSENRRYQLFTPQDVYKCYYNENRDITEVYFKIDIPVHAKAIPEDPKAVTSAGYFIGALTQFAEDDERENRLMKGKKIYKNCIMFIPKPDLKEIYGIPFLFNEVIITIQKMYLRFYQMLYLHKGGLNRMLFMPPAKPEIKQSLERAMKRGFINLGEIIFMDMNDQLNAQNAIKYQETPTPIIPFEQIEYSINSEANMSQQNITGSAEGNTLSGTAGIVSGINDSVTIKDYQMFMTRAIKDVNHILFDIDPNTYTITYNKIETEKQLNKIITKEVDPKTEEEKYESHSTNGVKYFDPIASFFDLANKMGPNSIYQIDPGLDRVLNAPEIAFHEREMIQHSIGDQFVDFKVNLFKAGTYKYPEREFDNYVTYTKEDIKKFTMRDLAGRTGYLDIDHQSKISETMINEGIGWWETIGFDEKEEKDITMVHLRKQIWEAIGKPQKIKVSPRFVKKVGPNGTDIAVIDVAVLLNTTPRSELTGLKTEGEIIKKNIF